MKKRPTNSSNEQASTSPPVGGSMSSTDALIGSWSSIIGSAICSGAGSQATARGSEPALGGAQVETVTDENSTHEFQPARDSDGSATYYPGIAAKSTTECLSLETNADVSQSAVGGSPLNGDLEQALVGALEGLVQSQDSAWRTQWWQASVVP